ncbi:MAG TPA: ATP-binding protein [Rhizomicrobium sp.]|jgi:signal transduction histidine kinase
MSIARAETGVFVAPALFRRLGGIGWNIRAVVPVCMVLICGSFASAAAIQMRLDRMHALSQAGQFGRMRAGEMAVDLGRMLDGYASIAVAFATAHSTAETSAALELAGGAPLRNVAVLGENGQLLSEMTAAPRDLLPLPASVLSQARRHRALFAQADGRTVALLFPRNHDILAVQIDSGRLFAPAGMADGVLATPGGRLIARGANWSEIPPEAALALAGTNSLSRIVEQTGGARLVSLQQISGWPLVVGASLPVQQALTGWYGALPVYLFFILGPSLAGAALAVLFVRVFERHARAAAAVRALRSTRPAESQLLVRLAHAERRAFEADSARTRFMAQVNHELRTPLNAIIGFAEAIDAGVFGAPGHPKYAEYARDIGVAGRELHAKIGAVLEYAALGKTVPPEAASDNPVSDVVAAASAQLEIRMATAEARGVKLLASLPLKASARVDAGVLGRILAHLLDNAVAYTPKGGSVHLDMRASARDVVIVVRDTGAGFTKAERERVGQPFQRFARADSPGGMGLGLAIAMGLTRGISGATLSLASVPGDGTRVELRLPGADK